MVRCSWTRSATCRSRFRRSSSDSWTTGPFVPWEGDPESWTCCWCRRRTPTSAIRSPKAVSVPTCCFELNTLEVTLQRLRERIDFPEIARHLLRAIDPEIRLTERAIDRLARQEWQGNIRELRSVLSRLTLTDCAGVIDDDAVAEVLGSAGFDERPLAAPGIGEAGANLHDLQRARVLAAYSEAGNNISKTARRLGVSRNMIYRALQGRQN